MLFFERQIQNADDISKKHAEGHQVIYATVVKVTDGDTIRVRHIPNYPFGISKSLEYSGKLSDNTISVRLYGVDCPETAKFGNPAMPFATEATDYIKLRTKCYDKKDSPSGTPNRGEVVRIKLLSKDQYGRVIAKVKVNQFGWLFQKSDLSLDLLDQGYATVYTGGGAQYDNKKDQMMKALQHAQKKKKGMWCNGISAVQTPAEYKQATKKR